MEHVFENHLLWERQNNVVEPIKLELPKLPLSVDVVKQCVLKRFNI